VTDEQLLCAGDSSAAVLGARRDLLIGPAKWWGWWGATALASRPASML
jgi:hypothetical protein